MAKRIAYVCVVRWTRDLHFLWLTCDSGADRVVTDDEGHVLAFLSDREARRHAAKFADVALESPFPYDLSALHAWCDTPNTTTLDVELMLNAWNLFTDLPLQRSHSVVSAFAFKAEAAGALYEKLFWANNLPAATPMGAHFVPQWSDDEIAGLSTLMRLGIAEFLTRISISAERTR